MKQCYRTFGFWRGKDPAAGLPPGRSRGCCRRPSGTPSRRWESRAGWKPAPLALLLLAAELLLGQAVWFDRTCSPTYDETFYLGAALQTVHDGRIDARMAEYGCAPLPVLLCHLPVALATERMARPVLFGGDVRDPPLVSRARTIHAVVAGLGLLLTVSIWLWRRRGAWAAAVGALLLSCSPTLLAHISVATTDALFSLGVLWALAALVWYRERPESVWRMLTLCAAIGVAISLKYSGILLLPLTLGVLVWDAAHAGRESLAGENVSNGKSLSANDTRPLLVAKRAGGALITGLIMVYLSFIVAWACHGFEFSRPLPLLWPTGEVKADWLRAMQGWQLPTPIAGVLAQVVHNQNGHGAFFLGAHSKTGWWLYFPVALAIKSTVVEWLLALMLIGTCLWRKPLTPAVPGAPRYRGERERKLDSTQSVWLPFAVVYSLMLLTARINIGVRYALPLYPLLILLFTDVVWSFLERWPGRRAVAAALLVAVQVATCLLAGPDKLSYFSPVVGGSSQGYRYLADSNVDWGQDLPRLGAELDRRGYKKVLLAYFGTARPEAYGIETEPWRRMSSAELSEYDAVAVSVTLLEWAHTGGDDPFSELRDREPAARVGNSMMLYNLKTSAELIPRREST